MKPRVSKGLCGSCYTLARYHRKKHDPAWKANYYAKINESKRRCAELKAAADLARLTQTLEDML